MRADIEKRGGEIHLKSPARKAVIEEGNVQGVEVAAQVEAFDKMISTIPLPYVPGLMPDLPTDILQRFQLVKNIALFV